MSVVIFKLRLGASIPWSVCRLVGLSLLVCLSVFNAKSAVDLLIMSSTQNLSVFYTKMAIDLFIVSSTQNYVKIHDYLDCLKNKIF